MTLIIIFLIIAHHPDIILARLHLHVTLTLRFSILCIVLHDDVKAIRIQQPMLLLFTIGISSGSSPVDLYDLTRFPRHFSLGNLQSLVVLLSTASAHMFE